MVSSPSSCHWLEMWVIKLIHNAIQDYGKNERCNPNNPFLFLWTIFFVFAHICIFLIKVIHYAIRDYGKSDSCNLNNFGAISRLKLSRLNYLDLDSTISA